MGNRLKDKVAVVTGAGRGIGQAIALLMSEEGAKVVVNDLGCEVNGVGASTMVADEVVAQIKLKFPQPPSEITMLIQGDRSHSACTLLSTP